MRRSPGWLRVGSWITTPSIVLFLTLSFILHPLVPKDVSAQQALTKKPSKSKEQIEAGKRVYNRRCWFCHGEKGDGDGPVADYLDPRPRDFTKGLYKFRTTGGGEFPTDEDLFKTITQGIKGTAMPEWGPHLSEEERWQVVYFIETFAPDFSDPEFDPYKALIKVSTEIRSTADSIAKGKEIFKEMKCWECHGESGRGDGPNSPRLKDQWKRPILPFDLTKGWRYKGGNTAKDIYLRFNTGLNGTPMPSFTDSLNDEERWHLANYVASLQKHADTKEVVLKAKSIRGELPLDPDDPLWEKVKGIDIPLIGQILATPRWQNPSIDMVTAKALYSDDEIAILLEWGDRFKDTDYKPELELKGYKDTYVKVQDLPRDLGSFRDSIAIQFPVNIPEGPVKPHFFRGNRRNPVNLWVWKADLEEQGKPSVEEVNAAGYDKPPSTQPAEGQEVKGRAVWKDGRWRAVMKRSLTTQDKNDVQFERGRLIPIALNAWDGANGEHGFIMSLSTWRFLLLERAVPLSVYLYAFLGVVMAGGFEVWLLRKGRRMVYERPKEGIE